MDRVKFHLKFRRNFELERSRSEQLLQGNLHRQASDRAAFVRYLRTEADKRGNRLIVVEARTDAEFEPAFSELTQRGARALVIMDEPLFNSSLDQLAALAAHHSIPAIAGWKAARALDLTVPPSLLARAHEVIELTSLCIRSLLHLLTSAVETGFRREAPNEPTRQNPEAPVRILKARTRHAALQDQ